MKKIQLYFCIGLIAIVSATSCKKFLDVNENPNSPTSATPELLLPQAIVRTAGLMVTLNDYGARLIGYEANAGGVSGWGSFVSYNYGTGDWAGIFYGSYKANEDFQQVIDLAKGESTYGPLVASAMIMKAFNYQTLVDVYNDVPYTEALKGVAILQPKYDKGEVIYKALADSLDVAMAMLEANPSSSLFQKADPLFKGDNNSWIKFANTIKLRLILRSNGKVAFTNKNFNAAGFLTDDALVNPGYTQTAGKQNPTWETWAFNASGTAPGGASQRIPTPFILSYYDGSKIYDTTRAKLTFNTGLKVPTNQLGYQGDDAKKGLKPSAWFVGKGPNIGDAANIGILKSPTMGQPLMLAAESYFLQAQANVKGITGTPDDASVNYYKGITASFKYLQKDGNNVVKAGHSPTAAKDSLLANNIEVPLVNFELATTDAMKIEAIVTQEYVAYNMILGHQAWFEYLRTGYPTITGPNTTANKKGTFVSTTSESTAPDRLPTRVLYPANEFSYNQNNVPTGISPFTSKIFWAK